MYSQYHPDKINPDATSDVKQQAMDMYSAIDKAWQILSNPSARKKYDAKIKGELAQPAFIWSVL